MICDKCQKHMILKNGKYGIFLGCSNYPLCKNTKNIYEYLNFMECELKKSNNYNWNNKKQSNDFDKKTNFIYTSNTYSELLNNPLYKMLNNFDKSYAETRWINFLSAKATEIMFGYSKNVEINKNQYDKLIDFKIQGITFDHKGTIFPKAYLKNIEYTINNKEDLINWLYLNQSKGQRQHFENRLFVVFYSSFREHYELKKELLKINEKIQNYMKNFNKNNLIEIKFENGKKALSDIIFIRE